MLPVSHYHILVVQALNNIIPWLLTAEPDNARTEGEGERGTKLSQVYYGGGGGGGVTQKTLSQSDLF